MLYNADVYDPTREIGRDQYLFYFRFDESTPRRWSCDHARHISWWIASKLLEGDESVTPVTPRITKGMLIYLNQVKDDLQALPKSMYPICEGITVGIGLSPDLSPLRSEVAARLRLQVIANEILAQLRAARGPAASMC
jgi:hypothetical protein